MEKIAWAVLTVAAVTTAGTERARIPGGVRARRPCGGQGLLPAGRHKNVIHGLHAHRSHHGLILFDDADVNV